MSILTLIPSSKMATIFVTVGTFGFETLVAACTNSTFLKSVEDLGYTKLVIQYGPSEAIYTHNIATSNSTIKVEGYAYKPNISEDMKEASLIISHAGKTRSILYDCLK